MIFGGSTAARRARRPGVPSDPGAGRPHPGTVVAFAAATAGAGLVTLSGVAWASPVRVPVTHPAQVQQAVHLSYDAGTRRSAAYPAGRVRTGDPVFFRLVPSLDVRIAYRADPDPSRLSGTRRVTAELRAGNGWHRGIELLPRERFTGGSFDVATPLDLRRVRALISGVETATGVDDGTYTLSVRSEIALGGTISAAARPGAGSGPVTVKDSFFPELTFAYDDRQLTLTGPGSAGGTTVDRVRISTVPVPGTAPGKLTVLGLDLPVGPLRTGGLIAGLALFALALLGRRTAGRATPDRIVRRIVLDDAGSGGGTGAGGRPQRASRPGTARTGSFPIPATVPAVPSAAVTGPQALVGAGPQVGPRAVAPTGSVPTRTRSGTPTRTRVPGPRTTALAEQQSARAHRPG